jgi:fructose-1,6-bisphosphatase
MRLYSGRTSLSKFLIEHCHTEQRELAALLIDVAAAVKAISSMAGKGALGATTDQPVKLDALANDLIIDHCEWSGLVAGMLSEMSEEPIRVGAEIQQGAHLLAFDPLDGSSNVEVDVSVGSIFSILRRDGRLVPSASDYLQPGAKQVAAGYALYGPCTMLVLTIGRGTHGFTLDREIGNFILTHPNLTIDPDASEFAINTSNERFWEPPIKRYVSECKAGSTGIRGRDFNMRWIASMVADVHRILLRGGVYMYPRDERDSLGSGRVRLLYEANPVAFLVEQAGGAASTGRGRVMDVQPQSLHQRTPLIFGSRNEIERIERYYAEHESGTDKPYYSPLFASRSLLRADA